MCITPARSTTLLALAMAASAASLALAYVSEYGFGLKPCELCIFQRVPYALILLLGLLGFWKRQWVRGLCVVAGLLFLVDGGIAAYHTGVEKHWFPGPTACTDAGGQEHMTLEEILAKLKAAPIVACDQPQWEFHGITMAGLNAVWAFALSGWVFVALHKMRQKEKANA